jgi:hypothetical protein
VSQSQIQLTVLVIGLLLFGAVIGLLFLRRRAAEHRDGGPPTHQTDDMGRPLPEAGTAETVTTLTARPERRRPEPPPLSGSPGELTSAIRSLILRTVAERSPAGWSALVLCPPPHSELITWHVHLAPEVALDLADGRSVAVAAPLSSHEWQLAGGRIVSIGEGEPDPPPTEETAGVRVTGPYLVVAVRLTDGRTPELTARVMLADGEEIPWSRAVATDTRAVRSALRQAVEHAVGSRMLGTPPAVGYRRSSWVGHERIWLTIAE